MAEVIGSEELSLIRLDSYYVAMHDQPIEVRATVNYDHPDAFDWDLLYVHLQRLTTGESVEVPIYDFTIYDRTEECEVVFPGKVVVVEGILVLWEPRLRGMLDLKVFVDTPVAVCEQRDPKGLYKKARAGEIKNFTGVSDPYEAPTKPEVVLKSAELKLEQCVAQLAEYLQQRGLLLA